MSDNYEAWRERLASGINTDFYTIEWLDQRIVEQTAFCIATEKAAIVIEFKAFPSGNSAVHGLIAAGEEAEIENELIPMAEAWGKAVGCRFGLIESRPAWAKIMKKHGYEPFQTAIVKELR